MQGLIIQDVCSGFSGSSFSGGFRPFHIVSLSRASQLPDEVSKLCEVSALHMQNLAGFCKHTEFMAYSSA